MLKILLSILIIALCFLIGRMRSARVNRRVACLKEMGEILKCLEADMKNERLTLQAALIRESARSRFFSGLLAGCARIMAEAPGRAFSEVWEAELKRQLHDNASLEGLLSEDIALIGKTGKNLVHASLKTQEAHFNMLHGEYGSLAEKAASVAGRKSKLYQSLGLMAGFFIAILLL